jgi:uncharacterized protein DUF1579
MSTWKLLALVALAPLLARAQGQGPKPGPEHALLAKDEGTWDATVEMMFGPPGSPATTTKGTETNRMLGGFWLVSEFESEMGGQPFRGHGVMGFDPARKRYVGTWVDSMTTSLATMEASYDPKTRTLAGFMDTTEKGKKVRMRETTERRDDGARVFSMYAPGGSKGKERLVMRITYVRRAAAER